MSVQDAVNLLIIKITKYVAINIQVLTCNNVGGLTGQEGMNGDIPSGLIIVG